MRFPTFAAGVLACLSLCAPALADRTRPSTSAQASIIEPVERTRARYCRPAGAYECTPAALAPGAELEAEIACLAELIYWEARGEPILGRMAVVDVVLRRVERHWRGETTLCGVARDRTGREGQWKWQFVGMQFEGRRKAEPRAWRQAQRLARFALTVHWRKTVHADHFWAGCDRIPPWVDRDKMWSVVCIGAHYFWRHE